MTTDILAVTANQIFCCSYAVTPVAPHSPTRSLFSLNSCAHAAEQTISWMVEHPCCMTTGTSNPSMIFWSHTGHVQYSCFLVKTFIDSSCMFGRKGEGCTSFIRSLAVVLLYTYTKSPLRGCVHF